MIDISKVKWGRLLENRKIWKGVYFSRFWRGLLELNLMEVII